MCEEEVGPPNDRRLSRLRAMVKDALDNEMSTTAVWFADKLVTLSRGQPEDVLLLARSFYANGDFARAARALETRKTYGAPRQPVAQFRRGQTSRTAPVELRARLLAARCLAACGRHAECASILEPALAAIEAAAAPASTPDDDEEDEDDDIIEQTLRPPRLPRELDDADADADADKDDSSTYRDREEEDDAPPPPPRDARRVDIAAAACSVAGQAFEALENRPRAVEWLTRALEIDPECAEALAFLVERRLLSAADEKKLHAHLARALGGGMDEDEDAAWIVALYGARLCVHDCDSVSVDERFDALERIHGLGENNEVLCAKSEHAYYRHDCRAAHRLAKRVYASDPFDFACVPIYLASMVELGLSHELFYCAHELVKAYPKRAQSWFAVGCYYLLVGKNDAAQRYFHKSAKLEPRFAPAWIGFGNAFAAQDESEQAMAAYRSASRLFQGSHVPLMFIGMEYLRTNNLPLAKHFLKGAKRLCASDPMVSNELGVVELRQSNYRDAEATFKSVLDLFDRLPHRAPLRLACESSVFNLAQVYRKMRDFPKAAHYFELALSLHPCDAAIRAALGATYHALGGEYVHRAVDCYHVALGMRPDDTFCSEMLTRALKDVANVDVPNPFPSLARVPPPPRDDDDDEDLADAARHSLQRLSCDYPPP
ncbi:hypothetical protein CTAYLR_006090 [Chrysophaeum taylorii]|uniref:Anaphase-promoting complex subunit 6 n=1 Tax=Chrysophaeum taylorii TaxID=2483200 RepID=A0AAD7U9I0_9STRA|nr:hypothetical protein CTAYLR_006090 [Chrysophaeum taylorii]